MPRILLRSRKDPFTPVSAEETLRRNTIGSNVGNLVFSHAAHRILARSDTVVVSNGFRASVHDAATANDEFDHFVVPLANAFRPNFHAKLGELTRFIRKLTIPVTILGVGAQGSLEGKVRAADRTADPVKKFVSAVLDRAPSIGVRGEFTRDYLVSLGFPDSAVEVIGCPSMFLRGPELAVERKVAEITAESPIALNVSPYVSRMGQIVMSTWRRYPDLTYFAQDWHSLNLMLWGRYTGTGTHPDVPIHMGHPLYQEDKTRFCLDPWTWFDELAARDFSFGTRIHGNIAALLAGTPALVLAHDSRTLELARYYEIPHRLISELGEDVDAAALYAAADWGPMVAGHAGRWQVFADFLDRHGLRTVFEPGETGAQTFDDDVARVAFPEPVHTLAEPRGVEVANRLAYLRDRVAPLNRDIKEGRVTLGPETEDEELAVQAGGAFDAVGHPATGLKARAMRRARRVWHKVRRRS